MLARFYTTNTPKHYMHKEKTLVAEKIIVTKNNFDLKNPTIIVGFDESLLLCNYIRLTIGGKYFYYFVLDKNIINKEIHFTTYIDGLATDKDNILNSQGLITRCQRGNKEIGDRLAIQTGKVEIKTLKLGNGFTASPTYILTIGG